MEEHILRRLDEEEKKAIEVLMAEFDETHRTFNHLISDLEKLEALTRTLEQIPDGTRRMRLIKEHGGKQLVRDLQATLNRLLHDEQELLRDSSPPPSRSRHRQSIRTLQPRSLTQNQTRLLRKTRLRIRIRS